MRIQDALGPSRGAGGIAKATGVIFLDTRPRRRRGRRRGRGAGRRQGAQRPLDESLVAEEAELFLPVSVVSAPVLLDLVLAGHDAVPVGRQADPVLDFRQLWAEPRGQVRKVAVEEDHGVSRVVRDPGQVPLELYGLFLFLERINKVQSQWFFHLS